MEKEKYKKIVKKYQPKENRMLNATIAFVSGGLVGVLGQSLIDLYTYTLDISTKDASAFMIVTLIFLACLFTALGFFDRIVNFCRCGLIIPITGFAHSMMSAGMEYRQEGAVTGIGSNVFKLAGSVILYGVVSAWFFGLLRLLIMGG